MKRVGDDQFRTFVEAYNTVSPTKFTNVLLKRGDIVRYVTPGGGGYGDPLRRDPQAVLADVRNGWVSVGAAQREYGVIVVEREDDFIIDEAATAGCAQPESGRRRNRANRWFGPNPGGTRLTGKWVEISARGTTPR